MTLQKVTLESKNKLGSLPGYVTSQNHKAGVIVIQEVNLHFIILNLRIEIINY